MGATPPQRLGAGGADLVYTPAFYSFLGFIVTDIPFLIGIVTASSYRRRLVIKTKCTESKGITALIGAFCCFDVQNKTKGTPEGVPSAYMMIDIKTSIAVATRLLYH